MKIIGIEKNYKSHVFELNHEIPKEPIFFIKPDTCILKKNQDFFYPNFSKSISYEVELVIKIEKAGRKITEKFAHRYYKEIGIGINFTAKDLEKKHLEKSLSLDISKCFDHSASIGSFLPKEQFADINNINFSLLKNDKIVQADNSKNILFTFDKIIAYISQFLTLKIGDLIFTGTPKGLCFVNIGDHLKAKIENEILLDFNIR